MKFQPKAISGNVNVSKTHPLTELFWLLGGLVFFAGLVFSILGFVTDLAVSRTPISLEKWIGEKIIDKFSVEESPLLQRRFDSFLLSLNGDSPLQNYNFKLFISKEDEINAFALPGGYIVVNTGLLREVESENELAMVLYHELGHFAHRDHLRGLGRGLSINVAFAMLFGRDSAATELVSKTLLSYQVKYTKEQELAADRFGLEHLARHYGHAGGATDFFARLSNRDGEGRLPYLLASHPHPEARINYLNGIINLNSYAIGSTIQLSEKVKNEIITAGRK